MILRRLFSDQNRKGGKIALPYINNINLKIPSIDIDNLPGPNSMEDMKDYARKSARDFINYNIDYTTDHYLCNGASRNMKKAYKIYKKNNKNDNC